jgi:hypothetical protein
MIPPKKLVMLAVLLTAITTTTLASTLHDEIFNNDTHEIEMLASEALKYTDEHLTVPADIGEKTHLYKIYNSNKKLVYECRDATDERLICLLRRSDRLMTTDSSSYYYLAD